MTFPSISALVATAVILSACAALRRNESGSSPDNAIMMDTIDLDISATALTPYRIPPPIEVDIHHLELDLRFDWEAEAVIGKAKLTLSGFFDAADTIALDARGFEIHDLQYEISANTYTPHYEYSGTQIKIIPTQPLRSTDTAVIRIDYTARPTLLETTDGSAITSDQGLYFINAKGEEEGVPKQIWSQGEPECNSAWFPSVDQPHEKFSQEIFLTVDTAFHTISNGKLMYSSLNADGTKTDYWKQDLPHANYLVMIAIGEFSVTKDSWNGKDVWYYTDQEYRPYAQQIFGNTPEMLSFYSKRLGYAYPWDKYHQVVVRDFVSGAMENTSAVIHGDFVQQTDREMIDGTQEDVIAHELFHHWFGDLVTCQSWSQLTMNEGFATYGEYLWKEYKYGVEEARLHLQNDLDAYLREAQREPKKLLRYHYTAPDDVFDSHTYQKGGRVLHMLRQELGDTAFFASLNHYLKKHAFGSADIDDLRHAVLETTGRDLSWFFDQWYRQSGHPLVSISYRWDDAQQTLKVRLRQVQESPTPLFRVHVPIMIGLEDGSHQTRTLWLDDWTDTFAIALPAPPSWYSVDPYGDLLWEAQEDKALPAWKNQMKNGPSFVMRQNALFELSDSDPDFILSNRKLLLNDPFWVIRGFAVEFFGQSAAKQQSSLRGDLIELAQLDEKSLVRVSAYTALDSLFHEDASLEGIFISGLKDQSYAVVRTCLSILIDRDPCIAASEIGFLENEEHGSIQYWVSRIYSRCPDIATLPFFERAAMEAQGIHLFLINNDFTAYAIQLNNDMAYASLVKSLTRSALESETWWSRTSAVQGLKRVEEYYTQEIDRLSKLPESTTDELERISDLKNKKASLAAMLEEINELGEPGDSPFRD